MTLVSAHKKEFISRNIIDGDIPRVQFSSIQSLSHVWFFETPWTTVHQASLSITNSPSLLRLISIQSVMPFKHLILCCPLFLPPSIFPSIRRLYLKKKKKKKKKRANQIFCNSLIAQLVKNPSAMKWRRPRFNSCIRNICWRRNRLPTPVSWSSLVAQLVKNQSEMLVTWVWSVGWEDPLEKGKTNHSSKAWRIPWTVYPWGHKQSNMTEWLSLLQFFRYFEAE